MRKNNPNFNAISVFTELSKILEDSHIEILRLYSEDLAKIPYDSKKHQLKLTTPEMEQKLRDDVQDLSSFLKITPLETLLFIAVYSVETVRFCAVDIRDIARFFDISNLDFLLMKGKLYSLLQKGLIRQVERRHREEEYRITGAAERALLENKPYKLKKASKIDRYKGEDAVYGIR